MALLGFLGTMLIRSIVRPLQQVGMVFRNIAAGQLDSPITIHGKDEICTLLFELRAMQSRLAAHEQAIHQLAYFDPLTRLPNRRLLRDRIQGALEASGQDEQPPCAAAAGPGQLQDHQRHAGARGGRPVPAWKSPGACARPYGEPHSVARIGGDEFVVLMDHLPRR